MDLSDCKKANSDALRVIRRLENVVKRSQADLAAAKLTLKAIEEKPAEIFTVVGVVKTPIREAVKPDELLELTDEQGKKRRFRVLKEAVYADVKPGVLVALKDGTQYHRQAPGVLGVVVNYSHREGKIYWWSIEFGYYRNQYRFYPESPESNDCFLVEEYVAPELRKADPSDVGYTVTLTVAGAHGSMKVVSSIIKGDVGVGDHVNVVEGSVAVSLSTVAPPGVMGSVTKVIGEGRALALSGEQGEREVVIADGLEVEEGDTILLDFSKSVVIGRQDEREHDVPLDEISGVTWDVIGGQASIKSDLRGELDLAFSDSALKSAYGIAPFKGALLAGPPGCGKTMIAKAIFNDISARFGGKPNGDAFIHIKGPELLSKWIGETEAQIRAIFARGKFNF